MLLATDTNFFQRPLPPSYLGVAQDGIKFVKDADETVKWLVERVFPLLRSSAEAVVERFQRLLSRDRSSHAI